ncbi:hypothetical protein [Burkholderia cepacia]|uniref:hypothetical protein n=1 Tax=Burkholderia cepacia TaxID=292 RepID=UPI002FE2EDB0
MKHHYIGRRKTGIRRRVAGTLSQACVTASRTACIALVTDIRSCAKVACTCFTSIDRSRSFFVVDIKTKSISKFVFGWQFVRLISLEFDLGGALSIERGSHRVVEPQG